MTVNLSSMTTFFMSVSYFYFLLRAECPVLWSPGTLTVECCLLCFDGKGMLELCLCFMANNFLNSRYVHGGPCSMEGWHSEVEFISPLGADPELSTVLACSAFLSWSQKKIIPYFILVSMS